jgi:hypothetical protein
MSRTAMADSVLHDVSTRVARGGFAVILTTLFTAIDAGLRAELRHRGRQSG